MAILFIFSAESTGNFFAQICARRQVTDSNVTAEVDSYLLDKSCELSSINHYPHLKRL